MDVQKAADAAGECRVNIFSWLVDEWEHSGRVAEQDESEKRHHEGEVVIVKVTERVLTEVCEEFNHLFDCEREWVDFSFSKIKIARDYYREQC